MADDFTMRMPKRLGDQADALILAGIYDAEPALSAQGAEKGTDVLRHATALGLAQLTRTLEAFNADRNPTK